MLIDYNIDNNFTYKEYNLSVIHIFFFIHESRMCINKYPIELCLVIFI